MHWAPFLLALGPSLVVAAAVYAAARGRASAPAPPQEAAVAEPASGAVAASEAP